MVQRFEVYGTHLKFLIEMDRNEIGWFSRVGLGPAEPFVYIWTLGEK